MSSPSKFYSSSPIRNLQDRYSSRPLEVILEEQNALRLSNSLIYKNQLLEEENGRLLLERTVKQEQDNSQTIEAARLRMERDRLEQQFRSLQARSHAANEAKEKQLEGQERDIRFLREEYNRENQVLRDQITSLTAKNAALEAARLQDIDNLRRKFASTSAQQTNLVRRNLGEELRVALDELEVTRSLLAEKELQLQHLLGVSQQNSLEYTGNLQRLISENNVLRNSLLALELEKNKEIQVVQGRKELQKSRTIGILSFCKENNHFLEKELSRLSEQLLSKNISIESFTKELSRQQRHADSTRRSFEDALAALKQQLIQAQANFEAQLARTDKLHKAEVQQLIEHNIHLQEALGSKENQVESLQRELDHVKKNVLLREKEIEELKDNMNRLHDDHSKELSKVMNESRVKRRSGLNISSYSSSSLKDIEDAQGSSILKGDKMERKSSFSNEGSGRLPTVKEELAISHGHIDDDEDIQIKELILHYESMIEEIKKNKKDEVELLNSKIQNLREEIRQKERELEEVVGRYAPLMEMHVNRPNIEAERKAKIEHTQKGDLAILSVLLDKYQIASLKPRGK